MKQKMMKGDEKEETDGGLRQEGDVHGEFLRTFDSFAVKGALQLLYLTGALCLDLVNAITQPFDLHRSPLTSHFD